MGKKVLAIYYTQSGQMTEIIDSFTAPLSAAGIGVEKIVVQTETDYAFPWTGTRFFSVMPDCVLGVPQKLQPYTLKETQYDLVILGYQPWFLSPSIPSNSIIQDATFRKIIKHTPVVTISAARNMWLSAYERVHKMLTEAGAQHVGNIALVDKHPNFVSFVTIFYWMLTGKKERYLNKFPKPGVDEQDIIGASIYGEIIAQQMQRGDLQTLQRYLMAADAVVINYPLMVIEGKAKHIFRVWAKFISKRRNKAPWITAFKYYLFAALFLGAPLLITLDSLFIKPFSAKSIRRKKLHYSLLK
jgi:hypothetical protein